MQFTNIFHNKLIIPALLLVLLATLGLNHLVSGWHYILPSEPGKLLYAATYDDFTDEWQQYNGRLSAEITNGVLQIRSNDVQSGPYSVVRSHFSDFDLRVDAQPVDGPLDNGYGVIFRLQDPYNYYLFLISSDGYYQVSRVVNGEEKIISTWLQSSFINQGIADFQENPSIGINRIRVITSGSYFRFFVNDQLVLLCLPTDSDAQSTVNPVTGECLDGIMTDTLQDTTFSSGQLGVVAKSLSEPGVMVNFDNFLVYGPEPIEEV